MKTGRRLAALLLAGLLLLGAASAEIQYGNQTFTGTETFIDLGDMKVKDFDALAEFLAQMPQLRQVNMFGTKIRKAQCDALAERFPEIRWGWTMVVKGSDHEHLIRTDQTAFSTLHNNQTSHHRSEDFSILKYCWNLFALDLGHNSITTLDFLEDVPNLRVLILACNTIQDITPISKLTHLEYAELFKNDIRDISPVTSLTHLLDLNVCFNHIQNLDELKQMTWLKRLWMYSGRVYNQSYSEEEAQSFKKALPDTEVDTRHYSTAGTWRYLDNNNKVKSPHYAVITATFGDTSLRPKLVYIPFVDSYPFTEEEQAAIDTARETLSR